MQAPLTYESLDMERAERSLAENGQLLLTLPPEQARACIEFIEAVRSANAWRRNRVPLLARLKSALAGFSATRKIRRNHPRLLELATLIITRSSSQSWEQLPSGEFLFKFAK